MQLSPKNKEPRVSSTLYWRGDWGLSDELSAVYSGS